MIGFRPMDGYPSGLTYFNSRNFIKGLFSNPSSSGLRLKSARKHYVSSSADVSTRVRSVVDTLTEIIPLCVKIGITRISDITFMDRLYIPNYSAILPGTGDIIWVYGGKGTTKLDARASALMEAIERYSSLSSTCARDFIQGNYLQLSKSYNRVLHPNEVLTSD
jgi:ribosomal protein S12 methylthiotransferase accessory factor YcaO